MILPNAIARNHELATRQQLHKSSSNQESVHLSHNRPTSHPQSSDDQRDSHHDPTLHSLVVADLTCLRKITEDEPALSDPTASIVERQQHFINPNKPQSIHPLCSCDRAPWSSFVFQPPCPRPSVQTVNIKSTSRPTQTPLHTQNRYETPILQYVHTKQKLLIHSPSNDDASRSGTYNLHSPLRFGLYTSKAALLAPPPRVLQLHPHLTTQSL